MRGLPIGGLERRQTYKKDQISANFGKSYELSSVAKTTVFPHTHRHVRVVKMILRTPSFIISNKKDGYWLPLVPQTAKRKNITRSNLNRHTYGSPGVACVSWEVGRMALHASTRD